MSYTIKAYPGNLNANKLLIVAKFGGLDVSYPDFKMGVDNKTDDFLKLNPIGQVPTLISPEGAIFESNACARYLARKGDKTLLGNGDYEQSLVESFTELARSYERHIYTLVIPIKGWAKFNQEKFEEGNQNATKVLTALEKWLADGNREWLVGGHITIADISWFIILSLLFQTAYGKEEREKFPHVLKWFHRIAEEPHVKAVFPLPELPEKALKAADQQ